MTIVQYLLEKGAVSKTQINQIRDLKNDSLYSMAKSLLNEGVIDEETYQKTHTELLGYEYSDLEDVNEDLDASSFFSEAFMRRYSIFPVKVEDSDTLVLAMSDPTNILTLDDIRQTMSYRIQPILSSDEKIKEKIDEVFSCHHLNEVMESVIDFSKDKIQLDDDNLSNDCAILNMDRSPIVYLVNQIVTEAEREGASDIHIEPLEKHLEVRLRVDGLLKVKAKIPRNLQKHLISRIKIMAELDISECRRPQDGRIRLALSGRSVDLRLSVIPTVFGEKAVLRLLNQSNKSFSIDSIGLRPEDLTLLKGMTHQPQGMVLACGPTGSGKTSTLYAALNEINNKEKNIVTIEDPVEYTMKGVNQIQVNEKIGVTFLSGLKSVLRQDPDVILVGEIRDAETAEVAFRSALTGHLVFSTIHTNSSIASVTRFRDLGIDPFLISSSVLGIVSQRLLRVNCPHCRETYTPPASLIKKYSNVISKHKHDFVYKKGCGCLECNHTGFKGRLPVFEILPFNQAIRNLINESASENELFDCAREFGFSTLIENAMDKVIQGVTTIEEVISVIGSRDDLYSVEDPKPDRFVSDLLQKDHVQDAIYGNQNLFDHSFEKAIEKVSEYSKAKKIEE